MKTLYIASTFTAQPVRSALGYWCEQLAIDLSIQFAPVGQVFQQLLNPQGEAMQNDGINVILLRFEDIVPRSVPVLGQHDEVQAEQVYREALTELVNGIDHYCQYGTAPLLLVLCPPSPSFLAALSPAVISRLEEWLNEQVATSRQFEIVSSQRLAAWYPIQDYFDQVAYEEGMIPYIPEMYTALGTVIARFLHMLISGEKYKVIVTDCDNTLWAGICGETDCGDLLIDEGHQALQMALVRQVEQGRLVCLCSRNNEEDVWRVFDTHPDMILRREHLVAWKLNWQPKHRNIRELADQLNLSPSSFVFLDDDPAICEEIETVFPEVLTYLVPADSGKLRTFVDHVWAFDRLAPTPEDRVRTLRYQQERARKAMQVDAPTYDEFLKRLNVAVTITPMSEADIDRAAQLLRRTTQFNSGRAPANISELKRLVVEERVEGRVIRVTDRFGDYGLTGCFLYREDGSSLAVEVLALSCRVLGRGVEGRVMRAILDIARESAKSSIKFLYAPTDRNIPVRNLLTEFQPIRQEEEQGHWTYEFAIPSEA